jgi:hypothetical protein
MSAVNRCAAASLLALALMTNAGCKEELPAKLKPGQSVTIQGAIEAGAECPMLATAEGRRFSLAGDLKTFTAGDRVCVSGRVAEAGFCMSGEAVIAITTIAPENHCK